MNTEKNKPVSPGVIIAIGLTLFIGNRFLLQALRVPLDVFLPVTAFLNILGMIFVFYGIVALYRKLPANAKASDNDPQKMESYAAKRFFITFAWTTSLLLVFILFGTGDRNKLVSGFFENVFGMAIFALFPGLVSMAIQTNRKIIFVPVSILICIIVGIISIVLVTR